MQTVLDEHLARVAQEWHQLVAERGYDGSLVLLPDEEALHHDEAAYSVWNHDGTHLFDGPFDGVDDGIIWEDPCPRPRGGGAGCATAFFLEIGIMNDDALDIHERILIRHVP